MSAAYVNVLHRRKTPPTQLEADNRREYYRNYAERLHLAILAAGKITTPPSKRSSDG